MPLSEIWQFEHIFKWLIPQGQKWCLNWNLHLQVALPCVCPAHPCWFVSPVSGWVSAWQLGSTFSQAAAHWRLKPPIHSSGSISKDLFLSSHDFIIIIIALMKCHSWAHYKAWSPCLTWDSLFYAFPLPARDFPPVSVHCWRALRSGLQPWRRQPEESLHQHCSVPGSPWWGKGLSRGSYQQKPV